jgi:hypothetical protein
MNARFELPGDASEKYHAALDLMSPASSGR